MQLVAYLMVFLRVVPQTTLRMISQVMTVARYRSMALRPINRIKHVVDSSAALAAGVVLTNVLVQSTDTPTLAVTNTVETGSKVNGIYLRVEVASNEAQDVGAIPNVYMAISKDPGGNLAAVDPNLVGASDNKRFVIHQEMAMIDNKLGGNPRTLFNGVIVIPKGMRRMGPNDTFNVTFESPALNIVLCWQAHYKEFR